MADRYRYAAFVSYSSKDAAIAKRIHRALENYRIPRALGSFEISDAPKAKNRIFPCFRDREELPSGDLGAEIQRALENSSALVVVCSPNSAKSQWVNAEVEAFHRAGRSDRIFAIIVDGLTSSDAGVDEESICFAPGFRREGAPVVVAGDLRPGKDGFRNAVIKVVAGIIGVNLGKLIDRDKAARTQRAIMTAIPATLALIAAIWAPFAYQAYQQNVALSQEAVRRAESGDETASALALLAMSPPRPYFFVDTSTAREVISQWGDDRQLSREELASAQRIVWPREISLDPNEPPPEHVHPELRDFGNSACPDGIGGNYYMCEGVRGDVARTLTLAASRDRTLRLVEKPANGQPRVLLSMRAEDLQPQSAPAQAEAPAPASTERFAEGSYADLFAAVPLPVPTERVNTEVQLPLVDSGDWGEGAEVVAWSSGQRFFWIEQREGAYALRSADLPERVTSIRWIGPSAWLLSGYNDAHVLTISGAQVQIRAVAEEWLRTPTGMVYSRKHQTGLIANQEGSTVFRWQDGQFARVSGVPVSGAWMDVSYDDDWFGLYAFGRALVLSAADGREVLNMRIQGSPDSLTGFVEVDGAPHFWISHLARGGTGIYALAPYSDTAQLGGRICSVLASDPERRQVQLASVQALVHERAPLYAGVQLCGTPRD